MSDKEEAQELQNIIQALVTSKGLSYFDALIHHCEVTGLEIEVAAKLLTRTLKKHIKEDAMRLNLVKKSKSGKLAI